MVLGYNFNHMKNKIIVLGSSNIDMVVKMERFPVAGETILGGTFLVSPSGKGANQTVAIQRLGKNVRFVSKLGNNIFGKQLLKLYKQEGMNTDYILIDSSNLTGIALITVDSQNENNIVVAPGANVSLSKKDMLQIEDCFNDCSYLLMQLEIPIEIIKHAASQAKMRNRKTILNPTPDQNLPDSLLKSLYMITPNKTEAEMLSGIKITKTKNVREAANIISTKGMGNVIITLGSEGAFVKEKDKCYFVKPFKAKAMDTTAVGDTPNGTLCFALSEGFPIVKAAKLVSKAASISVTRMGRGNLQFLIDRN